MYYIFIEEYQKKIYYFVQDKRFGGGIGGWLGKVKDFLDVYVGNKYKYYFIFLGVVVGGGVEFQMILCYVCYFVYLIFSF